AMHRDPVVARVLLQDQEILKAAAFDHRDQQEAVTEQLHSCKELLLACENAAHDARLPVMH
ncbi:MAG: hypothetical protein ACREX3_22530, partial [Gammaproteobacteria bacterium]